MSTFSFANQERQPQEGLLGQIGSDVVDAAKTTGRGIASVVNDLGDVGATIRRNATGTAEQGGQNLVGNTEEIASGLEGLPGMVQQGMSKAAQIASRALLNLGHTGYNAVKTGLEDTSNLLHGTLTELVRGWPSNSELGANAEDTMKALPDVLKHIADNYLVPMSESSINDWALGIKNQHVGVNQLEKTKSTALTEERRPVEKENVTNELGLGNVVSNSPAEAAGDWLSERIKPFEKHMQETASGLYPSIAPQIMSGIKTKTLAAPYHEVAKRILGPMAEDKPNWADPKWSAALTGSTDLKTGRGTPMPLSQWGQFIRTEPSHNYDQSPEAMERVKSFTSTMNAMFSGQHIPGSGR